MRHTCHPPVLANTAHDQRRTSCHERQHTSGQALTNLADGDVEVDVGPAKLVDREGSAVELLVRHEAHLGLGLALHPLPGHLGSGGRGQPPFDALEYEAARGRSRGTGLGGRKGRGRGRWLCLAHKYLLCHPLPRGIFFLHCTKQPLATSAPQFASSNSCAQ